MPIPTPHLDYKAFVALAPEANAGLIAAGKWIPDSGLDKGLIEMVKLRVSQMNACSFCTALHLGMARKAGVDATKLDLLAAWRDTGIFSEREMAALEWAEHLTRMASARIPEDAYAALREHFSERDGVLLTAVIASINAWNRICASLCFPISQAQAH